MEFVRSKDFGGIVLAGQGNHIANGCDSRTDRRSYLDLAFFAVIAPMDPAGKAGECSDSVSKGGALKVRLHSQRLDIGAPMLPV